MDTTIRIAPPFIYLNTTPKDSYKAHRIGWNILYDKRKKAFKLCFGVEALIKIKEQFPNVVVSSGQEHIDQLKADVAKFRFGKQAYADVKTQDPVSLGNYKLTPYKHQLQALRYMQFFDGAALFGDCGIGKTPITLWDIEARYIKNEIPPSSVLIAGKLMTLESGWFEDTLLFTDLNPLIIWEPIKSKTNKKSLVREIDHGKKPEGPSKNKKKVDYYFKNGQIAILKNARAFKPSKHNKVLKEWKEVNGVKYGIERWFEVETINIRNQNMTKKIKSRDHDIHIINHESLLPFKDVLAERRYELIVIDESTVIKNPSAKITSAVNCISLYSKYRRILSGTPSPQGPQDLWSQFYFLDKGLTFGPDYYKFLDDHFNIVEMGSKSKGTYAGIKILLSPEKDTLGYVHNRLKNRIFRCRLEDCVDLPPLTRSKIDVYLTDEQQKHYDMMSKALFTEIDGKRIEVNVALAKIGKLRQITGGFLLARDGEVLKVSPRNPKLEVLLDFISQIDPSEKVVIFAVFRCEIELLLKTFRDEAVAIYGGISSVKQIDAQKQFKTDPKIRFIICQPQSAAYGVNGLTVSRYLLFYSIDSRADCNYQAIKRIQRTGQTRAMFVSYLIACGTYDEITYKAIYEKDKVQQETINQEILKSARRALCK